MNSRILLILVIVAIAFAQPHPKLGRDEARMTGAYHQVGDLELDQMKKAGPFQEVERSARMFYQGKTGKQLGDIISIEKQVVSGMNYKITFGASAENTAETVIISIFYQPWTKTIDINNILPPISGVTDETGRLLPQQDQTAQN